YRVLAVPAANRDEREQTIIENFDDNYTGTQKDDYDVLITTEVLSEGVNLHRANVILNYDTPWNSTRLMQRIGRVNRIGSTAKYIYVYNFLPSAQGDEQIDLVKKAHTKIQSFHVLFGEDSKIFTDDEVIVYHEISRAIDDEESPLQKYIYELRQFRENHPARYSQIKNKNDGWQIASSREGTAYFLIQSEKYGRLAIQVTDDEQSVISDISLIENLCVNENTPSVPLPDNWTKICRNATLYYKQYFVKLNGSRAVDKKTQAKGVVVKLFSTTGISQKTKNLLQQAQMLVNGGNIDMIRKILKIGAAKYGDGQQLFDLKPEEIDKIIEQEIEHLVKKTDEEQGIASILLATVR
ncbi:MAG: ATP-dependent helicase, partial [Prevotella sp.]|nr:ATP-dependent helicase [Prevotella sp.]